MTHAPHTRIVGVAGACCAVLAVVAPAIHGQTAGDSLTGIWVSHSRFRSASPGELLVERRGDSWQASLADARARPVLRGDSVHIDFGAGRFRGALSKNGELSGYWLQASSATPERPSRVGYRQPFATKLVLPAVAAGRWRGTVRQVPESFTLYLKIYRDSAGQLVGAFRNHDFNSIGGASLYHVSQRADSVFLTLKFDENQPEIRHAAVRLRSPDALRLFWDDVGTVLTLERKSPAEAANFFPRPPGRSRYVYRQPPMLADGWTTARARDVGIDEAALTRMVQQIIDTNPALRGAPLIHSLLVAHKGKLVLEEYFYGYDRDTPHDLRSAGKTFASVMLGGAMRNGAPLSPQTKVYELLAGLGPFANPDPRKAEITLAHLMTHSSGLACNDNDENSPGNEDKLDNVKGDWWKYTLDLPMAHPPGTRYAYCSATMSLMGAALTHGTRTWLPELFDRTVARPLQFGLYHWNLTPTDEGYLAGGSRLRSRDFLKVGQAYLDGGVWNGRRIVDSSWVKESTRPQIQISEKTTGLSAEDFGNSYGGGGADGYAWHLGRSQYSAGGNGGQILMVAPEHQLVVVFTGANFRQGWIWTRWEDAFVGRQIIPAIATPPR